MKWLSTYRITPAAIVLLAIFVAAAAVAFVAAYPANVVGFIVAIFALALPLVGQISGGRGGLATDSLADRRREFAAKPRRTTENVDPAVEAEAWELERQRYQERRSTAQG
jgi:hypothetical protein